MIQTFILWLFGKDVAIALFVLILVSAILGVFLVPAFYEHFGHWPWEKKPKEDD